MKLAEFPIITLSCSAGLVIAVILGILIYKRRRTRMSTFKRYLINYTFLVQLQLGDHLLFNQKPKCF